MNEPKSIVASADKHAEVTKTIVDIFKEIGMPPHLVGYNYAIEAIYLTFRDPRYLRAITYRLYPDVASKCGGTAPRIERGIRNAIESVFDRGDMDRIRDIFGNTMSINRGKLTNSEFLEHVTYEVRRRMAEKE